MKDYNAKPWHKTEVYTLSSIACPVLSLQVVHLGPSTAAMPCMHTNLASQRVKGCHKNAHDTAAKHSIIPLELKEATVIPEEVGTGRKVT